MDPNQEAGLMALADGPDYQPGADITAPPDQGQAADVPIGDLCAGAYAIGFGLLASRRGAHWALNEEESKQLGQATGAVLDKYLPDMQTGPELALLTAAVFVMAPRLIQDGKDQGNQVSEEEGGNDDQSGKSEHQPPEQE